jgi:hypothetical protein
MVFPAKQPARAMISVKTWGDCQRGKPVDLYPFPLALPVRTSLALQSHPLDPGRPTLATHR